MPLTNRQAAARMRIARDLHAMGMSILRERIRLAHPKASRATRARLLIQALLDAAPAPDPAVFVRRPPRRASGSQ